MAEVVPDDAPASRAKLIAGLIALIGALVGAGAFALWRTGTAPAQWREYASPNGGYRVELPAAPRADIARLIDMPPDPNTVAEGTAFRGTAYAVMWSDFPDGHNGVGADAILSGAIDGLRQEFGAAAVEGVRNLEADAFAAREAAVNVPGEGRAVFRVVVTDARLFVLAVAPGTPADADVQRFLDSFRVTDPASVAGRDRRRAEVEKWERERKAAREMDEWRKEEMARSIAMFEEQNRDQIERQVREQMRRVAAERAELERTLPAAEAAAARLAEDPKLSVPNPQTLKGLALYMSFDEIEEKVIPVWPKGSVPRPEHLRTGPGPRGRAVYLAPKTILPLNPAELPASTITGPSTVAAWARAQKGARACVFTSYDYLFKPMSSIDTDRNGATFRVHAPKGSDPGVLAKPAGIREDGTFSAPFADGAAWHHVALTRSGTGARAQARLYLDGKRIHSLQLPPGPESELKAVSFGGAFDETDPPFGSPGRFPHVHLPIAAVDEVCVFDRALSDDEVKYLAGKGPLPKPKP